MNFQEFEFEMNKLRKKFGDKLFDATKLDLIFKETRHLSQFHFQRIVEKFVGEDVRAKLSDFRVESNGFKRFDRSAQCLACRSDGWLLLDIKPNTSIRCHCNNGSKSDLYLKRLMENELLDIEFTEKGWDYGAGRIPL